MRKARCGWVDMTEIGFYHITCSTVDLVLPKLLEKVLASGKRALLRVGSEIRVKSLNTILWTYEQDSFLPHGTCFEGYSDNHPIWITHSVENPNNSQVLIVLDNASISDFNDFDRYIELFDGNDVSAVNFARERWKNYFASGHALTYWEQSQNGGWVKSKEYTTIKAQTSN